MGGTQPQRGLNLLVYQVNRNVDLTATDRRTLYTVQTDTTCADSRHRTAGNNTGYILDSTETGDHATRQQSSTGHRY